MTAREIVADAAVIGRGQLCGELCDRASRGLASVLVAPAGRGKSALLAAVAESWHSRGLPVLSLTAAPADQKVPYAVVAELFATLGADCPCLEGPQKDAVRWVLRQKDGPEPDLAAVRLAALSCATKLNEQGRILLIADDLQWWDSASAEVLAFLTRRARGWLTVVAAARPDGPNGTSPSPLGRDAAELAVPPLTASETAALLDGRAIPHRLAGRVHASAGGNPRLAIEIARGLGESADALDQASVTSPSAQRTVRGWLAELPEAVWQVLLIAAVAVDPASTTLRRAAGPAALDALAVAERAGLIALDAHGTLTFPAGAVRETLLADASEGTLRNAHRLLADASPNPADRLWHAASAREGPDEEMVRALTLAAATARRQGERGRAAELALLAAEMVPAVPDAAWAGVGFPDAAGAASSAKSIERSAFNDGHAGIAMPGLDRPKPVIRWRSGWASAAAAQTPPQAQSQPRPRIPPQSESAASILLGAAVDAGAAGRLDLARTALARLDSSGADPASRARARVAVVDAVGQALAGLDTLLGQALADAETAGDPALLSAVHLRHAWHAHLALGRNDRAQRAACAAVRCAEQSGDAEALTGALVMMARIQQVVGVPECSATLRRALALGTSPRPGGIVNSPQWTAVRFAVFADRLDEARHHLRSLTPCAERSGSFEDLRLVLRAAIEIEARAGNGGPARRLTERLLSLPGAETASPGPAWHAAALAELAGGTLEQALRYAELGTESSAQEHDQIFLIRSLAVSGKVRLLLRDAAGAAADLRRVRDLEQRQGVKDPATVLYHADLAEACVALGELDEATEVITAARSAAAALGRRGVLASLDRAEGVRRAALGDFVRAEALLLRAERTFDRLGLPLEQARVLLAQSVIEKRQRRAARSRSTYQSAADIFAKCGAELWAPHSIDHGRTGANRTAPSSRTPAQRSASRRPTEVGGLTTGQTRQPGQPGQPGQISEVSEVEAARRTTGGRDVGDRPAGHDAEPQPPSRHGTALAADDRDRAALTPAERRVVRLVAAGCANREVAATLFLSVKTVEAVLTGVYRKLGVRSRTQLCLVLATEQRPPLVETG